MSRILLVEDDELLGSAVRTGLKELYATEWVKDVEDAEAALDTDDFDLVLLDINLSGKSGLELLSDLRAKKNSIPVMILTARNSLEHKIKGLDLGADDYLVKPFDFDELVARIRALLRRSHGRASPLIIHGNIKFDIKGQSVTINDRPVSLSAKELGVLTILLENTGRVFNKAQIEDRLYGWDTGVESNTVEVHISALRKKLYKDLIKTIRGVGYVIEK